MNRYYHVIACTVSACLAIVLTSLVVKFGDVPASAFGIAGLVGSGFLLGLAVSFVVSGGRSVTLVTSCAIGVLIVAGLGWAFSHELDLPSMLLVLIAGSASVASLYLAYGKMWRENEPIRLESDWGSLGHGFGGWQLSASGAMLLSAFVFAGVAAGPIVMRSKADKPPGAATTDGAPGSKMPGSASAPQHGTIEAPAGRPAVGEKRLPGKKDPAPEGAN